MSSSPAIGAFLAGVRSRLRRRALARAGLYLTSAAIFLAVAAPLAAVASGSGSAAAWIAGLSALAVLVAAAASGLLTPRRRWRSDRAVAAYVGRRAPVVASDLLSAVELGAPGDPSRRARGEFSPALVAALTRTTAARLDDMAPDEIVSRRPLWRPVRATAVAAVFAGLVGLVAPTRVASGWRAMVARADPPGRFGGAAPSAMPLVGDLEVTLRYPRYTGRDQTVLSNASGELRVVPGTRVRVDTTALAPAVAAWIAFDGQDDQLLPLEVSLGQLGGEFLVRAPLKYRFLLQGPDGRRRVEASSRAVEIEPDAVPRVELYAPAEELDVTGLKRVELAYTTEDDYGLTRADLVWDGPDGKPRRMPIELPHGDAAAESAPVRSAQNKLFWDLAEVPIQPGVRVSYHIEVFDNDEVNGPKPGVSRSYTLRVLSARERHERLIDLQRELFEKMVTGLGRRLVVDPADGAAHEALHRDAAGVVVELGTAVAALGNDHMAAKLLVRALGDMRGRLDKLVRREARLIKRLGTRAPAAADGEESAPDDGGAARAKLPGPLAAQLGGSDRAHVGELEDDVLVLADWLDRQDLENLLAINDEIKSHRERLDKLFAEYKRTKSPEIKAEIERELRALEQRLAELERRSGRMPADVLDQFVNAEAMQNKQADDCLAEVRKLFAAGDVDAAERKMRQCGGVMDESAGALEKALDELRGDKFSEQQKKFEELRSEIADLAGDQQQVADEADEVQRRYADQARDLMRQAMEESRDQLNELVSRLRRRVSQVPDSGLGQFVDEEMNAVKARLDDIERLLGDGDLAESLAMAREAEAGLETIESELQSALEEEGRSFQRTGERGLEAVERAMPVARKLVAELEKATPPPSRILGREDLDKLERMARRQQALQQRAERLAERSRAMADELPGESGARMGERLGEAGQKMGRAGQRMRARDPSGARQEAREAAEKLAQAKQEAQGAARQQDMQGRSGLRDEPVRIPGADEYRAPERFREDILDAMKKDEAPSLYRDMVKRYYEELIR
ncbi:MAG TPA: DUF4175 family protein [Kofleriaceae bacterium]|nr:DUF4175 family protein [Kofleriaceae bacterium]